MAEERRLELEIQRLEERPAECVDQSEDDEHESNESTDSASDDEPGRRSPSESTRNETDRTPATHRPFAGMQGQRTGMQGWRPVMQGPRATRTPRDGRTSLEGHRAQRGHREAERPNLSTDQQSTSSAGPSDTGGTYQGNGSIGRPQHKDAAAPYQGPSDPCPYKSVPVCGSR
jgi:hypothetical protein